jgi:preprotein translocase subunit YajC
MLGVLFGPNEVLVIVIVTAFVVFVLVRRQNRKKRS